MQAKIEFRNKRYSYQENEGKFLIFAKDIKELARKYLDGNIRIINNNIGNCPCTKVLVVKRYNTCVLFLMF